MVKEDAIEIQAAKAKTSKKDFVFAVGRRKGAVARVRLYSSAQSGLVWADKEVKNGEVYINQRPIHEYFRNKSVSAHLLEPLRVTNTLGKITVTVQITGGGLTGQLAAFHLGIARALALLDKAKHRPTLKKTGFLTRDARVRQRRKVGMAGKSRRKKQSPKR